MFKDLYSSAEGFLFSKLRPLSDVLGLNFNKSQDKSRKHFSKMYKCFIQLFKNFNQLAFFIDRTELILMNSPCGLMDFCDWLFFRPKSPDLVSKEIFVRHDKWAKTLRAVVAYFFLFAICNVCSDKLRTLLPWQIWTTGTLSKTSGQTFGRPPNLPRVSSILR